MSRSQLFLFVFLNVKCYNTLTCTLANEYPSSNEISKKNSTVRGDCIACDALFFLKFTFLVSVANYEL